MPGGRRDNDMRGDHGPCELKSCEIREMLSAYGRVSAGLGLKVSNLLMPIQAFSEMAVEQFDEQDDTGDLPIKLMLANIHKHTMEMSEVIGALRSLNYSEDKILEVCNPARIFAETLENAVAPTLDDGVAVKLEGLLADDTGAPKEMVRVDADDIKTIMVELCANAAHAMEHDGVLTVGLVKRTLGYEEGRDLDLKPGEYIVLEVGDEGYGMAEEHLRNIFLPFYTTRAGGEASGLGLWKVYGAIINLDGALSVRSHIGKGSVFSVFLPATRS